MAFVDISRRCVASFHLQRISCNVSFFSFWGVWCTYIFLPCRLQSLNVTVGPSCMRKYNIRDCACAHPSAFLSTQPISTNAPHNHSMSESTRSLSRLTFTSLHILYTGKWLPLTIPSSTTDSEFDQPGSSPAINLDVLGSEICSIHYVSLLLKSQIPSIATHKCFSITISALDLATTPFTLKRAQELKHITQHPWRVFWRIIHRIMDKTVCYEPMKLERSNHSFAPHRDHNRSSFNMMAIFPAVESPLSQIRVLSSRKKLPRSSSVYRIFVAL